MGIRSGTNCPSFCRVAIEEACKKHGIKIEIINVQSDHVHLIVDCPRTMCDSKMIQIVKGLSSYLLFQMCECLRKRYSPGIFGMQDIFVVQSGRILILFLVMSRISRARHGRLVLRSRLLKGWRGWGEQPLRLGGCHINI